MSRYLSSKMLAALEFAACAHHGQNRKGELFTPYISHPFAVGLILSQAGFAEDVVIAGICHDVLEDTQITSKRLEEAFGLNVLHLVEEVSEDKSLPFLERKKAYLGHLRSASLEAKAISAADLFANRVSGLNMLLEGKLPFLSGKLTPAQALELDRQRVEIISSELDHEFVEDLIWVLNRISQLLPKAADV